MILSSLIYRDLPRAYKSLIQEKNDCFEKEIKNEYTQKKLFSLKITKKKKNKF